MGALATKWRGKERAVGWHWKGQPGHHSGYPLDHEHYPGQERLYCFLDFMVSYEIMTNSVNLGPRPVTTSVQQYLSQLTDCYQQGYRMNHFAKVPDLNTITQEPDWACPHTYEAILSKSADSSPESQGVELKIVKKVVSNNLLAAEEGTTAEQLLLTIKKQASEGARLVCAQTTGYVRPAAADCHYGVMGVELFFETPPLSSATPNCQDKVPRGYRYHVTEVRCKYYTTPTGFQHVHRIRCDTDFRSHLKVFLDKGWKLVDICFATVTLPQVFRMKGRSMTIDTVWMFEKENLSDTTPRYEGVVLEYRHQVETCHGVQMPCRDWRPVIAGMGRNGWELATIVETPSVAQSAFRSYSIKLLFIFQRRIIASFARQKRLYESQFPTIQRRRDMFELIFMTPRRPTDIPVRHESVEGNKLPNGVINDLADLPDGFALFQTDVDYDGAAIT